MDINVTHDNNKGCIKVIGDIDERGAELFKEKLKDLQSLKEVEINFSDVGYIGSSGIGKLLLFYKNVAVHGGKMSVTGLQPDLFRLFKELKLETIFTITAK